MVWGTKVTPIEEKDHNDIDCIGFRFEQGKLLIHKEPNPAEKFSRALYKEIKREYEKTL